MAANWLSLLHSGEASNEDREACLNWRNANPEHELAWVRAEAVQQKLGLIPESLGKGTLGRKQRYDRRQTIKTVALLIAAGPLAYATYRGIPWREVTADYRTSTGERRQIRLADGSQLYMNTASALDIDANLQHQLITLHEGEILFETAPSSQRPWLVNTAHGQLRPIGTRFIVRQLDAMTQLGVIEGQVEIRPAHASHKRLSAGQQAGFDAHGIQPVRRLPNHADAWIRGVLHVNNMRLGQFVHELARYRYGMLRCDPAVADLRISGVFRLDETDRIIEALPATLPVQVNSILGLWVTIQAA